MTDRIGALRNLLQPLWALPQATFRNLHEDPAMAALAQGVSALYPAAKATFGLRSGLEDALVKLGIPCLTPFDPGDLDAAALALDASLTATQVTRCYLVPLDLADRLPPLRFGPAELRYYSTAELAERLNARQLLRSHLGSVLDFDRLTRLQWLIIEDKTPLQESVSQRAFPFLGNLGDLGSTMPHQGRYADPVTAALFALLIFPWEDWVTGYSSDWRGFSIPYVHLRADDLFDRSRGLPSTDDFAFEPRFDPHGEEDGERPVQIHLDMDDETSLDMLDNDCWAELQQALGTQLFSTPIRHFFVHAFFSSGMDEIMAHMTAVEAALGMQADWQRRKGEPHMTVTDRLVARVSAITGDPGLGQDYKLLFDVRSAFVHGRPMADKVPGDVRLKARRVARRVINALVKAALGPAANLSREDYLRSLA